MPHRKGDKHYSSGDELETKMRQGTKTILPLLDDRKLDSGRGEKENMVSDKGRITGVLSWNSEKIQSTIQKYNTRGELERGKKKELVEGL